MPYGSMKFNGDDDVGIYEIMPVGGGIYPSAYVGGIYQWGNDADLRSATTWSDIPNGDDNAWGNTTNTNVARQ